MTCVWIEGFETHYGTTQIARKYASSSGSMSNQSGRVFGRSGGVTSLVAVTPSIGGGDNTFIMGWGMQLTAHNNGLNSGNQGLYVETGVDEQFHVELESLFGTGFRLALYRGSTLINTTSYFDFGVWHYFELKVTVRDGTDGAYELRRNGVVEISDTGLNMADNATDGWDIFAFRYTTNTGGALRYDDMYLCNGAGSKNNDFLGPSIVEGILPNGAGASTDWTLGSGGSNNWDQVNDSAASTDENTAGGINHSDTNGDKDLYAFEDLTQITGTIHAIQVGTQLAMNAAGTRTVKTVYRDPDTTEADGASHVVDSTGYDEFTEVLEDNPASAAAWDVADIDDGQFGVEVVS